MNRIFCENCICLVEDDNKNWVCDEVNEIIENIEVCAEVLKMTNKFDYVANVRVRKIDKMGNTYHDITIIDISTGDEIISRKKAYGYGNHYKVTTCDLLNNRFGCSDYYTLENINYNVIFVVNKY